MNALEINKEYLELILSNLDKYSKDFEITTERIANSNAKYKGKPVPFLYHPMFFTECDLENFNNISATIMSITNKEHWMI